MPEVMLNGPGVLPVVGELVASGVPEHVRVYWEFQSRFHASPGNHLTNRARRQWPPALARKNVGRVRVIPLELPQCPKFRPVQRMGAGVAVLQPLHMEQCLVEIKLVPPEGDQFTDPQGVAVGDQNDGAVSESMPPDLFRRLDDALNLSRGQKLTAPALRIGHPARGNGPTFPKMSGGGGKGDLKNVPVSLVSGGGRFPFSVAFGRDSRAGLALGGGCLRGGCHRRRHFALVYVRTISHILNVVNDFLCVQEVF